MLVWSRRGRIAAWATGGLVFTVLYAMPFTIIALASVAARWNGALPDRFTFASYVAAAQGDGFVQLRTSLITGIAASGVALALGTCAALSLRRVSGASRRVLDLLFLMPSAVPSVSVGLGMLVAFSQRPILLNGTVWIVLAAHLVLVSAFTYGNVTAGIARLPLDVEQVAESLGASPWYRLRRVTLPLLAPYLAAAFSLSFALSMGELGATIMIYPPGWVTLPVGIFALSDRGEVFGAAALTVVLAAATLSLLLAVSRGSK